MTAIKFDSKVVADVDQALRPHAGWMFAKQGGRWVAVVELEHVERAEPAPEEDKDATVKLRITDAEIADDPDHASYLREILEALFRRRTKANTLDEHLTGPAASDVLRTSAGVITSQVADEIADREQDK